MAKKRFNVYFTEKTWQELMDFIMKRYGTTKALSITVEEAVRAYLARHRREV